METNVAPENPALGVCAAKGIGNVVLIFDLSERPTIYFLGIGKG